MVAPRNHRLTLTIATPKGEDPRERNRLEDHLKALQLAYTMGYAETVVRVHLAGGDHDAAHDKLEALAYHLSSHGFTIWGRTLEGYPNAEGIDVT